MENVRNLNGNLIIKKVAKHTYLRLFIEINKKNKKIREFSKEEELLKNDLKNRKSDLEVY